MREAHPIERAVGMAYYASDSDGTGGRLRDSPADFRVRELEAFDTQPADAPTGDYPWLVVRATLHEWDTNDFARELANTVGMSRERVRWAGTKDRHAVTTQLFAVRDLDAAQVPEIRNADIEVVGRAGRGLEFGDLAGNAFEIVVRDPDAPERAAAVADELAAFGGGTVGTPNYFGQQRFGSKRPVTHEVGLAILRDDWEAAAMAYLGAPTEHEPADSQRAREYVAETRDWTGALAEFPQRLRYERTMLHELADGGSFRDAVETFPSNLQQLFVHAAQSYVFNRIVSERMARGLPFGEPVAGDVVWFADSDADAAVAQPDAARQQRVTDSRVDVMARHCERGRAFVTAPLVGTDTEFADGDPGEITRGVLDDLDLSRADFDLPGEFDSAGSRRAILLRPDLTVSHDPLAFEFALPSGSYATVVLREFLKPSPLAL
ncbi:tRNA pseudouridine(13) synthase TruD [Halobacterium salinarum]|uniref:tRNA pseudouridine(13) synthase TruD n=1 Tax=Halobacterium salinarum TaxID=2242 RepID=UPI001F330196|nr:tRNA pseudouridine(13) synthase TruD [Halobacterium salinarum]MCF2207164.1 tRNA pseudouridine(13) synthase TruD [Halobacterium salinarum]MDL0120186.1 tRNA pseudouridine(13) synthase TruD [Halobacterium salinarum]MDL0128647.1 tRNA pseudouridine(13) synthase TruD [Halobacterium salinarum]